MRKPSISIRGIHIVVNAATIVSACVVTARFADLEILPWFVSEAAMIITVVLFGISVFLQNVKESRVLRRGQKDDIESILRSDEDGSMTVRSREFLEGTIRAKRGAKNTSK